jgi:ADP-ribose pyrophosphatase YjhB (NUDIX family)
MGMVVFDEGAARFNYRAGAICLRDQHILLNTTPRFSFWWIPGGRVDMRESSNDALRREMREELGVEIEIGRLLWVLENFFHLDERAYHELAFLFEVNLPSDCQFLDTSLVYEREDGGMPLRYRWFPLTDLDTIDIRPSFLQGALQVLPTSTQHVVQQDR